MPARPVPSQTVPSHAAIDPGRRYATCRAGPVHIDPAPPPREHREALRAVLVALLVAEQTAIEVADAAACDENDPIRRDTLQALSHHARTSLVAWSDFALLRVGETSSAPVPARVPSSGRSATASGVHNVLDASVSLMRCLLEIADVAGELDLVERCQGWLTWRAVLLRRLDRFG